MPDQGGDSEKVLSFSIDYSQGEIEDEGCIGGRKKMKILKFFKKSNFFQFFVKFIENFKNKKQFSNKISIQWLVEQDG